MPIPSLSRHLELILKPLCCLKLLATAPYLYILAFDETLKKLSQARVQLATEDLKYFFQARASGNPGAM